MQLQNLIEHEEEKKMSYKIFINGGEGTTGLRLKDRLQSRDDI